MKPSEIDDALRSDGRIEPSAEFRARVMRAVHTRAPTNRPHPRLERALWSGVPVALVLLALVIAIPLLERSETRPGEMSEVVRWLSFTLTGTFALAWRSTRRIA